MDLIYQTNRFNGLIHKYEAPDENINIVGFGDVDDGDILMSVKAEEEVVNKNDRSDIQKAIDKISIRGDQNVAGHIKIQQEKTERAPVPVRENIKIINENVDYKDILLNNIRDRYNKFNGDRTIIPQIKKEANEEFKEWNKNVNTGALANVDYIKNGLELINNDKKLPTLEPLFQLPEDLEDVDLNKANLIPTQLKEIMRKIPNVIAEETADANTAKSTLNIPNDLDTRDYDNLASQGMDLGTYNRKIMKMFDIGNNY
jgi:hypothetical protein